MLCAVFLGHPDLWCMSDRLSLFDMATVMKDPGLAPKDFTEERLAKMLDDLCPVTDRLMTSVAIQAIRQFRLGTGFPHLGYYLLELLRGP
jgi:hypothetical protein